MLESQDDEAHTNAQFVGSFLGSLVKETERATVVLAAAHIDAALEALLKTVLIPPNRNTDPLFDTDRALGTVSAKIELASRLGLIGHSFEHSLQMLRRIRNDFAHKLESETLASPSQVGRLNEMIAWAESSELYQAVIIILEDDSRTVEQAKFIACSMCMVNLLRAGARQFRRPVWGLLLDL